MLYLIVVRDLTTGRPVHHSTAQTSNTAEKRYFDAIEDYPDKLVLMFGVPDVEYQDHGMTATYNAVTGWLENENGNIVDLTVLLVRSRKCDPVGVVATKSREG